LQQKKRRNVSGCPGAFLRFFPVSMSGPLMPKACSGFSHRVKKTRITFIMANYTYLTQEGYDRIKAELDELKTTGRQEAAHAIAEARAQGDLSENAEYDAAKDAQGLLELKINDLETILSNARIIDESQLDDSKVAILSNVTIKNLKTGKEMTYKLVSESEADPKQMKISVSSPIGQGLLGKVRGDVAKVTTPAGPMEFEVIDISVG
jgi:transcription elongation factor GreA